MVAESDIKTVLDDLKEHGIAQISVLRSVVQAKVCADTSKLWLSTSIYEGGNYIPQSVRESIKAPAPIPFSQLATFVTVDENNFRLILNYIGLLKEVDYQQFKSIVEQFGRDAEEWRYYLDDFDKRDLMYVRR